MTQSIGFLFFFRKLNSRCVCAESLLFFWRKHKLWWGHIQRVCYVLDVYVVCVAVYVSVCVSTGIWPKASRVSCLGLLHNLRLTTYLPTTTYPWSVFNRLIIFADLFKLGTCRYTIIITFSGGSRISRKEKWRGMTHVLS